MYSTSKYHEVNSYTKLLYDMNDWAKKNTKVKIDVKKSCWYFEDEQDAIFFILRWSITEIILITYQLN